MPVRETKSLLDRIYETNGENGNYIIEISLANYAGIFNDWDHAPYKRKDIHPGLMSFLEDSLDDIPAKYNVDICFYFSEEVKNEERERVIIPWFRTYCNFYIGLEKGKIRSLMKNAAIYLLISIILLTASYIGATSRNSIVIYTLTEIVIVGGWVFLWEAISLLTFERSKISRLIKNYGRLGTADIVFRYK